MGGSAPVWRVCPSVEGCASMWEGVPQCWRVCPNVGGCAQCGKVCPSVRVRVKSNKYLTDRMQKDIT